MTLVENRVQQCNYRVIKNNCDKKYISDKPKTHKRWHNTIIFGELTCNHFDILMSLYGQVKKVVPFRAVPN